MPTDEVREARRQQWRLDQAALVRRRADDRAAAIAAGLREREADVLIDVPTDRWVRPMDVGGRDGSDHSAILARLVTKGLVERRRRGSLANMLGSNRGSWVYRRKAGA